MVNAEVEVSPKGPSITGEDPSIIKGEGPFNRFCTGEQRLYIAPLLVLIGLFQFSSVFRVLCSSLTAN